MTTSFASLFIGTLIATLIVLALCGIALGLGSLLGGVPLAGGCGRSTSGCAACPKRERSNRGHPDPGRPGGCRRGQPDEEDR